MQAERENKTLGFFNKQSIYGEYENRGEGIFRRSANNG